jgi:hypothetical protein
VFCAVFSYEVDDREAFERVYGPDGAWAGFFRRADGYLGTELLAAGGRYLLIDRWTSSQAYSEFLDSHRDEYERRAAEAEGLYVREERLGGFEAAPGPGPGFGLSVLPGRFAVCLLPPDAPAPERFWSLTRTEDELSVICTEDAVPHGATVQRGWRALRVAGPLDFTVSGVVAALTAPLAAAGISLLPVATYDTDHLFVREEALERAVAALSAAGHTVRGAGTEL